MNIYVGNLSYEATEQDIQAEFAKFGTVASVKIITDKYSGRSKGFAFVEMPSDDEAKAAITGVNGKSIKGREVKVNEARPKEDRPPRRE